MRSAVAAITAAAISGFLDRCGDLGGLVKFYENPTEEIHDAARNKKPIRMYARGANMLSAAGQGARARLEENYLYDTRRFPTFVAGEAFPVALAAGEYLFFGSAVGQPATNNGFAAAVVAVMSDVETNMDTASQIPQGKDYVLTQIGVSFNADIATGDANALIESGAIRFEKQGGQYTLKHGSPKLWPGGMGNSLGAANGVTDIRSVRKLAVPRVLRQKETFAYKYVVPRASRNTLGAAANTTLAAGCTMTIWLWGGQQDAIPV